MAKTDVLNIEEQIEKYMTETNKDDLTLLLEEFKAGHFPNVIQKSTQFQDTYKEDQPLCELLLLMRAVSHAQIGERKQSSEIIQTLYQHAADWAGEELVTLGELAFMCDYKLARRILSDAVKQMEEMGDHSDQFKLARGYLVLGESEEKLDKFVRAVKYYQKGLDFFRTDDVRDKYMVLYLTFKIGMLYSALHKYTEAIEYLKQTIELADGNKEIKAESLVSLAKIYGSKDEHEMAYPYLEESLEILENSELADGEVHAEALTEMAFYYFDQSMLDNAVPFYDQAVTLFRKLPGRSSRKLGMVYMQYAYCLEHKENPDKHLAGKNYEHAIEQLENVKDRELMENALGDVIAFFDAANNQKKKRYFEDKFVKMVNE